MGNEDLVHLKLEYLEALESKKDLLYSQKELISLEKSIQGYRDLRIKELKTKDKMQRKCREVLISLNNIQKIIPNIKVKNKEEKIKDVKPEAGKKDNSMETQLREIQRKLNLLQK